MLVSQTLLLRGHVKIKWICSVCGDIIVSDSTIRHQMDVCKCGMSGLDLEAEYSRAFGAYEKMEVVE